MKSSLFVKTLLTGKERANKKNKKRLAQELARKNANGVGDAYSEKIHDEFVRIWLELLINKTKLQEECENGPFQKKLI